MIMIVADARHVEPGTAWRIKEVLDRYPGDERVSMQILTNVGKKVLRFNDGACRDEELFRELRELGVVAVPW